MPATVPTIDEHAALAETVASAAQTANGASDAAAKARQDVVALAQRVDRISVNESPATTAHGLWLDDMPGATDDSKLDAAFSRIDNRDGTRSPVLLSNRRYDFAKDRVLSSGQKLIQPYGFGNQQRGANSIPCLVNYTGNGTWWTVTGSTFDVQFSGFGATSTTGRGTFMTSSGGGVLWTSLFRDLGFLNWAGVYGNETTKLLITAVTWDGWMNINNARGTSVHLGGADGQMDFSRGLIDTPQDRGLMRPDQFHMHLDYLEKIKISGLFMTADNVKGIKVSGNSSRGAVWIKDSIIEGRNAGRPSNQLIEINGQQRTHVVDCGIHFQRTGPHVIAADPALHRVRGCDFLPANGWTRGPVARRARITDCTSPWGDPETS